MLSNTIKIVDNKIPMRVTECAGCNYLAFSKNEHVIKFTKHIILFKCIFTKK